MNQEKILAASMVFFLVSVLSSSVFAADADSKGTTAQAVTPFGVSQGVDSPLDLYDRVKNGYWTAEREKLYREEEMGVRSRHSQCPSQTILVNISGVKLLVPRLSAVYERYGDVKRHRVEKECDVQELSGNISALWTSYSAGAGFKVAPVRQDGSYQFTSTYQFKKTLLGSLKEIINVTDKIKKFHGRLEDLYLFQPRETTGRVSDPVLVYCINGSLNGSGRYVNSSCSVSYKNSDGLVFSYGFFGWQVSEANMPEYDRRIRAKYQAMKDAAARMDMK